MDRNGIGAVLCGAPLPEVCLPTMYLCNIAYWQSTDASDPRSSTDKTTMLCGTSPVPCVTAIMSGARSVNRRLSPEVRNIPAMGLPSWTAWSDAKAGATAQVCRHSSVFDGIKMRPVFPGCKTPIQKVSGCNHLMVGFHPLTVFVLCFICDSVCSALCQGATRIFAMHAGD